MNDRPESLADAAGRQALERMYACLDAGRSFRLEAGAGAGKTYSLNKALQRLVELRGATLVRQGQQIACITYTNVAKDEIITRMQAHLALRAETVHGFCWSLLRDFQAALRGLVPGLDGWAERLLPVGGIGDRQVHYELGYPTVTDQQVSLRHDDVVTLMVHVLRREKFRQVLTSRYPVVLIDEYQDTDAGFVDALKQHFLDTGTGPLIGLFGDHWQKIYGEGCGAVEHPGLEVIDKKANFRSANSIVSMLNRLRPELPQMTSNPDAIGEARVFHTNAWPGQRRDGKGGGHWKGDVTSEAARGYLEHLRRRLEGEGWDFAVGQTKVLMLSHSVLAREQGYTSIPPIYGQFNDAWLKREDPHLKFLMDSLEPACEAFTRRRYGEMFQCLGAGIPSIRQHHDKATWTSFFERLLTLRHCATVGEVVDYVRTHPLLRLPDNVVERERRLAELGPVAAEDEPRRLTQLRQLRVVPYGEIIALDAFIDGHTPFATKHGVKGAEFENVLVIVGRGWNKYNFAQMLEWLDTGPPAKDLEFFERNRNLFYVACSRPRSRLALLFTQQLSPLAEAKLAAIFGQENVVGLPPRP